MALAVASTSTATTTTATTVTITKPSGVASGDLLVILASTHVGSTPPTCTGFTSKATAGIGTGLNPQVSSSLLWRIANASDVSASNYTVNGTIATMMRITGWTTGDPFFSTDTMTFNVSGSPTSIGQSVTKARPTSSIMLIVSGVGTRTNDKNPTWSSYSVTSGEANPSWTEVQDQEFRYDGSDWGGQAVAYATSTSTSNVTAWSASMSGPTSGDKAAAIFAIINEPQNITTDVGHAAATPTTFGITASQVNVVADVGHCATPPIVNGIETVNSSDSTQWINPDKPTEPTWINTDK